MNMSRLIEWLLTAFGDLFGRSGPPRQPAERPVRPVTPTPTPAPKQTPRRRRVKGAIAGSAAALALTVATIGGFEGLRHEPYRDIVGVWTVCYGETRDVTASTPRQSKAECDAMLADAIIEFEAELDNCMAPPNGMSDLTKSALVSWAYNVGTGAACASTLVRLVNAGNLRAACDQLPRWNKAGGQVVQGLTNRRATERAMCLRGLQ